MNNILNILSLSFLLSVFNPGLSLMTDLGIKTGSISGQLIDAKTKEPLLIATVALYQDDELITGTDTDFDGNFFFNELQAGQYDLVGSYTGYSSKKIANVTVLVDETTHLIIDLVEAVMLDEVVIETYKVPLIEFGNTITGTTITSHDVSSLPRKKATKKMLSGLKGKVAGVSIEKSGSAAKEIRIRGSRSDATSYHTDGVRISSNKLISLVPKAQIEAAQNPLAPDLSKGLLTAAEWNDLDNWSHWESLLKDEHYQSMVDHWGLELGDRVPVFVTNNNNIPMPNCAVSLEDKAGNIISSAVTDNNGRAELWTRGSSVKPTGGLRVRQDGKLLASSLSKKKKKRHEQSQHIQVNAVCKRFTDLDIMFVVDATGSMGDEINYLKQELSSVISAVAYTASQNEQELNLRVGSVFYRDKNDNYLTEHSALDSDIDKVTDFIKAHNAGGGGDNPEAVDAALEVALAQDWNPAAINRLCFLILDAPPHDDPEVLARINKQVQQAAAMGIKIIPITASGLDRSTEFLMKQLAIATNGTYVFLTDDSGIGNPHLTPVVPEYDVELLSMLLARLITNYSQQETCESQPEAKPVEDNNEMVAVNSYPNPTTKAITVDFEGTIDKLIVSSASGKRVLLVEQPKSGERIDLSDLIAGMYVIKLFKDDQLVATQKIIKL